VLLKNGPEEFEWPRSFKRGRNERVFFLTWMFDVIFFILFFRYAPVLPAKSSKLLCWMLWSELGTVSPWLGSPKQEFPYSTSPRRIRSRVHRIPHTNTCKFPGLIRVKKKKCKKAYTLFARATLSLKRT